MNRPQTLLVATDFSPSARAAEDAGVAWAKRFGSTLHWIHALEVPLPIFEPYAVAVPEATIGATRKAAQEKLEAAAARGTEEGLDGTSHLGDVPAAYAIADRAEELGADLVVIGTHGHRGVRRVILGSVAEKAVKLAPCSVLTVKGEKGAEAPDRILVGVDFSDHTGPALDAATTLAKETGASLHLLHALELRIPLVTAYEVTIPDGIIEQAQAEAEVQLAALADGVDKAVPVSWSMRSAPPHQAIVEAAEDEGADLIVTGSRGMTGLKHALLGSVAERTLRASPCSVWTVRAS
ncbi:MAG: hypothetical protein CL910_08520 [Deltaproteobacteria bacterium]|jgi:nucleotide-binding universal stress UspA family protein|nr:hypothetical protein [Deltaproteobacteria bacterium]